MKGTKIGTPLKNDVYQKPMYIAWMYLNDTYTFVHEDKEHKFNRASNGWSAKLNMETYYSLFKCP